MVDGMLTIKEYAELHGKSVQAVYKQIKSKENAKALEGHIVVRMVGNKNVKLLDDEAVAILERASMQSPQIILQTDDKERIEQLENENKMLLVKIAELQETIISKSEKIEQLQEANILLLEQKQEKQNEDKPKGFWAKIFGKGE